MKKTIVKTLTSGLLCGLLTANTSAPVIEVAPLVETKQPREFHRAHYVKEDAHFIVKEETAVYYDVPLSFELQDYIRNLCDEKGVPMSLIMAIIEVESYFKPDLISGTNDYGLMQINTCNHEWLREKHGITDFLDPFQNVFCGITILAGHYDKFGDVDMALMAYNLGAGGAKKKWKNNVFETRYTEKVNSAWEGYKDEIE